MHSVKLATAPATDRTEIQALARRSGLTAAHCDALTRDLPSAVDSLYRCRAWEVPKAISTTTSRCDG
jgi:hypothetical protein